LPDGDWTIIQKLQDQIVQLRRVERHLRQATTGIWVISVLGLVCMVVGVVILIGLAVGYGK